MVKKKSCFQFSISFGFFFSCRPSFRSSVGFDAPLSSSLKENNPSSEVRVWESKNVGGDATPNVSRCVLTCACARRLIASTSLLEPNYSLASRTDNFPLQLSAASARSPLLFLKVVSLIHLKIIYCFFHFTLFSYFI